MPPDVGPFQYPAVGNGFEFILEVAGGSEVYEDSRDEGIAEFLTYMASRTAACPGETYILAGFSQGADLLGRAMFDLPSASRDRIAFLSLFGDPRFQSGNRQVVGLLDGPFDWCYQPRQPWVRGTAECFSKGWYASGQYLPDDILLTRTGSWCRDGDVACSGNLNDVTEDEHTKYHSEGDVAMAMREAAFRLELVYPEWADEIDSSYLQFATGNAGADLVFVIDTTGSMGGEISDVASQATELANQWLELSPNGRVALAEFRDQGDAFVSRLDLELTDNPVAFQTAVNALVATGGGDTPEAQLSGIMTALNELDWQDGATKAAIVITDAVGKDPEPVTNFTRTQVVQRSLEIDPVAIYGVDVLNNAAVTAWMQPLAAGTAGEIVVLQPGQSLADLLVTLMDSVAMNPVASLHGPYFADIGAPVHFSAEGSFDPDAEVVSYQWDFDGNGSPDQTTSGPTVDHTYPGAYSGIAAVRVVSSDGGEALASTTVTVQTGGLTPVAPVKPTAAVATVTGPGQVTITWTPAASDHADGYTVQLDGTILYRYAEVGSGNSVTISGLDLTEPVTFNVRTSNEYGQSGAVVTASVGGGAAITTTRVSESTTNGQGNGVSDDSYLSADGRWVTYRSTSSNLVAGDTNGVMDAFVHDRQTGTTSRASVNASGVQGNAQSDDSAISADGRYVVFRSQASNFVTGDTNGTSWDIFRKDLQTGAIVRVSTSTTGAQSNGASHDPVVSADGRYVAFRSSASNLVTGDTNGQQDVFRKDIQTSTTILVSVGTGGAKGNALSDDPQISDDGNRIAFQSDATNLVSGDTNGVRDAFVRDVAAGTLIRASVSTAGAQGNGASGEVAISGDGTTVAWESDATNLVSGDTNAKRDVFVRVLATNTTTRVSLTNGGAQGTNHSEAPSLSRTGTSVAFESLANNLVTGDTNSRKDIFIRDTVAATTVRMSVDTAGVQGNDTSRNASIAAVTVTVAFESDSTNLIAGDTNGSQDVFVGGPGPT
jgi:Mg-chelatase subunit ChlD